MTVWGYSVAHSSSESKHASAVHNIQNNFSPEDKYEHCPGSGSFLWLQLCCGDTCEHKAWLRGSQGMWVEIPWSCKGCLWKLHTPVPLLQAASEINQEKLLLKQDVSGCLYLKWSGTAHSTRAFKNVELLVLRESLTAVFPNSVSCFNCFCGRVLSCVPFYCMSRSSLG